jgi:hypothetical protein
MSFFRYLLIFLAAWLIFICGGMSFWQFEQHGTEWVPDLLAVFSMVVILGIKKWEAKP